MLLGEGRVLSVKEGSPEHDRLLETPGVSNTYVFEFNDKASIEQFGKDAMISSACQRDAERVERSKKETSCLYHSTNKGVVVDMINSGQPIPSQ